MPSTQSKQTLAFVVPTLNELAPQNEGVVQLLLFAAARLAQVQTPVAATIITIEPNIHGWQALAPLFPPEHLAQITVIALPEPVTPNLAIASHKPAYALFEYLKTCTFDEIHCLDRYGYVYYATQAKQLGLYCGQSCFAVHIIGGTLFHYEAEDALLDQVGALMDDLLERGSVERADLIYVHDRKAWRWYRDKITLRDEQIVQDMAWPLLPVQPPEASPIATVSATVSATVPPTAILYYGLLSAADGLPLFCDAIDRLLPTLPPTVTIYFVGAPQAMGGMDVISYLHLRSAKWRVPVTIKRDLSISDEINLILTTRPVVVCNTLRREGLRARLLSGSGVPVLQVDQTLEPTTPDQTRCHANPNHLVRALTKLLTMPVQQPDQAAITLCARWSNGRSVGVAPVTWPAVEPLVLPTAIGPKVTVCITHFRRPHKLRTALASLKAQSYQNFEVIVIDDGSPDPAVQQELSQISEEIRPLGWRLLRQENRYLGAARNYGASQATGDYLLFMDDDNVAKAHELSTLVAIAVRTGSDIITSFFDAFESEAELTAATPPTRRFTPFGADATLGILTNCFGDANALYKRSRFEQVGGFTEDYGITHEDWEFFCRATLEGATLVCVPESLFWYRVDPGGMYRNHSTQLHKNANLRRHIRPYLAKLPYYQAQLVQLSQGLTAELPVVTVDPATRIAGPRHLQRLAHHLPYARVAVIMRTKDRPRLLRRGLRSVLDQTFQDWLLVIVNDGGEPESVELVLAEVADEVAARVLVLHHPTSLGMQTAANAGISRCDSDFIIIHDDDDSWQPTFLARTVSQLDAQSWNAKVGGVITWANVIVEDLQSDGEIRQLHHFIFNQKLHTLSLLELAGENRFPPISLLFHRAAYEVIGPFQEQYSVLGDWEFHLRLLTHYHIEVITEPLANYHHRTQGTNGVYGNSVHTQGAVHEAKRVELHNDLLRTALTAHDGMSMAQLLVFGDLHKSLIEQQHKEFQRLHDYMWTIEQRVRYVAEQTRLVQSTQQGRNFVRNGDFRQWPGPAVVVQGDAYAYTELCPGLLLCYNGHHVAYRVERQAINEVNQPLPFGKTYLHLENAGTTKGGAWFRLEWVIPTISRLAGQTIVISGYSRLLASPQKWIGIGGRYSLGDGREVSWPEQFITLSTDFTRWSCVITCPAIYESEFRRDQQTRIMLSLPYDQPFAFDLTDLQVELGTTPTPFVYNGAFPLRERLFQLWDKAERWLQWPRRYFGLLRKRSYSTPTMQQVEAE